MTRALALSAVKAGITRLREKGGASPESLFDLLNGYVTAERSIKIRPGSEIDHQLPEGTKGLVLFRGKFVVFADHVLDPGSDDYKVEVLTHPDVGSDATLVDILFAAPFLGFLYVVAKWSDGRIVHYYAQSAEEWQPDHVYALSSMVTPTDPNGLYYRAQRLNPAGDLWEASIEKALNDVVEPTTYNGFEYVAIDVTGDEPRTGTVEPTWIAEEGALVYEFANEGGGTPPAPPGGTPPLPPEIPGRYGGGTTNTKTSQL